MNSKENWLSELAEEVAGLSSELIVKATDNLYSIAEDLPITNPDLVITDPYFGGKKFTVYNLCSIFAHKFEIKTPRFIFVSSKMRPQTAVDALFKAKAQDVIIFQEIDDMKITAERIVHNGLIYPSMQ